jgi:tetratricopeptide (TPR) repeat protein
MIDPAHGLADNRRVRGRVRRRIRQHQSVSNRQMSDPVTIPAAQAADALQGRARDARVEQLLLAGLDHYFAGRYAQAIHVWTRVLFLDRGHARARAYIERARSAEAERQREADELLHRGSAAFEQGQPVTARRLLTAAIEHGAPADVPLAYLGRLDRLAVVPAVAEPGHLDQPATHVVNRAVEGGARRVFRGSTAVVAMGILLVACVAGFAGAIADLGGWRAEPRLSQRAVEPADPAPLPRASDLALTRARSLFAAGHARDALRLIATVAEDDPNRPDADTLLADIQRALLATSDPSTADAMSTVQ